MQPQTIFDVRAYIPPGGIAPFTLWLQSLDNSVSNRILTTLGRMAAGNLGDSKAIGDGVEEVRLVFGAGYRIYFGREAKQVILLLGGGTKRRQSSDIAAAKRLWTVYKEERTGDTA